MIRSTIATVCVLLAPACSSQLQPIDEATDGGGGDVMPVYVAEAFGRACGSAACHGGSIAPSLTPANAPATVGASSVAASMPFVVLGDVMGSYIALKMLPEALIDPSQRVGGPMPPPEESPDPADLTLILGWIAGTPPGGVGGSTGGSGGDTNDDTAVEDSTGMPPQTRFPCTLQDVAPGAQSPVVAGDEAGVIPTQIGVILDAACGCHLVASSELIDGVPPAPTPVPEGTGTDLTTLLGIQDNLEGVAVRIVDSQSVMPPAYYCEQIEVQTLTQADFDTLTQWLEMGAPDGASWAG